MVAANFALPIIGVYILDMGIFNEKSEVFFFLITLKDVPFMNIDFKAFGDFSIL